MFYWKRCSKEGPFLFGKEWLCWSCPRLYILLEAFLISRGKGLKRGSTNRRGHDYQILVRLRNAESVPVRMLAQSGQTNNAWILLLLPSIEPHFHPIPQLHRSLLQRECGSKENFHFYHSSPIKKVPPWNISFHYKQLSRFHCFEIVCFVFSSASFLTCTTV